MVDCFADIISTCIKNKSFLLFAVVTGTILTLCQLGRSYYIGLIAANLDKKDVIKYAIIVAISYVASIVMYLKTNKEIVNYNEQYFERFSNIFFKADFKEIIKHNEPLLSNFNESLDNINNITKTIQEYFVYKTIMITATTGVFFYYLPKVGVAIVITALAIIVINKYIMKMLNRKWDDYWASYQDFNTKFQNIMLNVWNIKYNSLETYVHNRLKKSFSKRKDKLLSWLNSNIISYELPGLLFFFVLIYNLIVIIDLKSMDISIRIFLILQLFKVWKDFYRMCIIYTALFRQKKNIEKICPVWMLTPKKDDDLKINDIESIEFDNVTFNYGRKNVLTDMGFVIKKGNVVLLLGDSGKGKSTIVNLICRLYDINEGNGVVKINNIDIKKISIRSLREYISVVPQTILVFNSTIRQNIILDNKLDPARIKYLAEILKLPDINKLANTLSYGQKQRVLIARALYDTKKSVYIFDEYLSAVDKHTASNIHKFVIDYIKKNNKIGIFISHHIQDSRLFNKIIKL